MTYEDGTTALWEYDDEGNVTKFTDPQGKVTRYEYYRDYLLHKVIIERGGSDVGEFVYSYDAAGRLARRSRYAVQILYPTTTGITAVFRDASDTPGSGFDGNGNLRYLRYMKSGQTDPVRSFEWTYDHSNNRESMLDVTPTLAVKWEYGYDWLDRLVSVKRAEASTVGALPASPLGSGYLQREYAFANEVLPKVESDNRTYFDDHVNGKTYHYTYTSIDDNGTTRYSARRSRYAVQLEEILVSSIVGDRTPANFVSFETFEHDQDGNMTKRTLASSSEEVSYEWTDFASRRRYEVRLKHVESDTNGPMQDSRYDVDGLRSRKFASGALPQVKNGNSSVEYGVGISTSASKPGSGTSAAPSISYVSGHMILGAEIDGTFVYHLGDALSSVRDVVDSAGNVIRSNEWDEYGNLISSSGSGTASPKTWVGGLSVNDDTADSKLYNMGHRNYAGGVLGRFISRDPIGFAGGLNLYNYGANSPVRFVDPEGRDAVSLSNVFNLPVMNGEGQGYRISVKATCYCPPGYSEVSSWGVDFRDSDSRYTDFAGKLEIYPLEEAAYQVSDDLQVFPNYNPGPFARDAAERLMEDRQALVAAGIPDMMMSVAGALNPSSKNLNGGCKCKNSDGCEVDGKLVASKAIAILTFYSRRWI